jgi:hypothetical protein
MFDSADTAGRLARTVPRARVTVLPEAAHSIIGQTQQILDFLRD